jgi:hypothetical protein
MPQEERLLIYTLAETGDPQSWSRALTDLAGTPPMPHPAVALLESSIDRLSKALRHVGEPHYAAVVRSREDIRHVVTVLNKQADNEQAV